MTNEELDILAARVHEDTRRLREDTIREFEQALAAETNRFEREHLQRDLAHLRQIGDPGT